MLSIFQTVKNLDSRHLSDDKVFRANYVLGWLYCQSICIGFQFKVRASEPTVQITRSGYMHIAGRGG